VDAGDVGHVVVAGVLLGGEGDVFFFFGLWSGRLACFGFCLVGFGRQDACNTTEPQAHVQVGVHQALFELGLGRVSGAGGGDHFIRRGAAGVEGVDLVHGDARVGAGGDGDEGLFRGFDALFFRDAEVVPGGVFDVVGIDGLVELELFGGAGVVAGEVEGQAALPVVGLARAVEGDLAVEVGDGGAEVAQAEVAFAAAVQRGDRVGGEGEEFAVVGDRGGEVAAGVVGGGTQGVAAGVIRGSIDRARGEGDGERRVAAGEGGAGAGEQVRLRRVGGGGRGLGRRGLRRRLGGGRDRGAAVGSVRVWPARCVGRSAPGRTTP